MKTLNLYKLYILIGALAMFSCNKGLLEQKSKSDIIIMESLDDIQGLLDYRTLVNVTPALPLLSSDEYYFTSENAWQSEIREYARASYVWAKDVYDGNPIGNNWSDVYTAIFYTNCALDEIEKIALNNASDSTRYWRIKGAAYFYRAYSYYHLLTSFSPAYDATTAKVDLGVPLKLKSDIEQIVQRATLQACYDQIETDLQRAVSLLPMELPNSARNRPSRLTVYALQARIHLSKADYQQAYRYSDTVLQHYNKLIDYDTVITNVNAPFTPLNDETLMQSTAFSGASSCIQFRNQTQTVNIDSNLIKSYDANDLRLKAYFDEYKPGYYSVRVGYCGSGWYPFSGLATDEIYLIKAESAVRTGRVGEGIDLINTLLNHRYVKEPDGSSTWVPYTVSQTDKALEIVLNERHKSLVWRTLRWDDLKRLNREGANITLKRVLGNKEYILPPNDPRWVFNIPQQEIDFSGIQQNIR